MFWIEVNPKKILTLAKLCRISIPLSYYFVVPFWFRSQIARLLMQATLWIASASPSFTELKSLHFIAGIISSLLALHFPVIKFLMAWTEKLTQGMLVKQKQVYTCILHNNVLFQCLCPLESLEMTGSMLCFISNSHLSNSWKCAPNFFFVCS